MFSKSEKIVRKTKKYCIKTTYAYPLTIKSGKGCYIQDHVGEWYLDFNTNVSSCNIGYFHPEIQEILGKYSKLGAHKIAGQDFYTEEQADLAEKLVKITPKELEKVFLINSGAEAVENAIKFAFRKKGPIPGVGCYRGFHGRTLGALTFTNSKAVQKKNFPEISHNSIQFCTSDDDPNIGQFEDLIDREGPPAFVLVECVQGEGGYRPASKKFIKTIRKVSKKYDFPLIIDEIQSGLGRTGKLWSFEHYGVNPDIIASAKSLQVGATITSKKYDPDEEGAVSSTWGGGHRIDMAVGLKTIEIIEKENLVENSAKMGKYTMKRLDEIKENYPEHIIDVRGLGLMIGVEFKDKRKRDFVVNECFKNGLLVLGCGFKTIRFAPPLIITPKEIDKGLEIFESAVKVS
ncbi:MAG: aminotransferase class III-fold pyridoxal phosphate-dependent enzyme [Candidatus Aenigmarchaeota archaeon]|nr:aminotransferase class III-fold pyridoxal phosphate-dependent enzyme [Candidatus Aenigmarchaeota archaeon]